MWNFFTTITEQVTMYSTITGQAWYLCVFVFRLIVVASIGSSVYGDEQSAFRCSTKVIGCDNVCYDKFAKISHIRFWSFQLLTLAAPVVIFHFYTSYVQGTIEKLKQQEKEEAEAASAAAEERWNLVRSSFSTSATRRRKRIGKVKQKTIYDNNKLQEVTLTRGIRVAYFVTVIARIIIEFVFLVLAYDLFRFRSYPHSYSDGRLVSDGERLRSVIDLFWIRVPQLYRCSGVTVRWACSQHLLPGNDNAYVPCWVSRPWEKTIFLRYMNTMAVVCLFLSIIETIHLIAKAVYEYSQKVKRNKPGNREKAPPAHPNHYKPLPSEVSIESQPLALPTPAPPPPVQSNSPAPQQPSGKMSVAALAQKIKENYYPKEAQNQEATTVDVEQAKQNQHKLQPQTPNQQHQHQRRRKPSRTRFVIPSGTQSLNRPKKVMRTRYVPLYKMGKISFSESDGGGDGSDDDGGDGSSSEETQRSEVSQHSNDIEIV